MKKYKLITLFIICLTLTGCSDFLNMDHFFKDRLNIDSVFTSKDYSERWLTSVYSQLKYENIDVGSKDYMPYNFISDDMFFGDRDNAYRAYKNGEYYENGNSAITPAKTSDQVSWTACYKGIRDASTYIHNIDRNKEMGQQLVVDTKAQARFLRAYLYWLLIRKYGPVPLLPDEGMDYTLEYDQLALPRNSYDECVDFITSELAIAAKDLPLTRPSNELSKVTKGAALAARAKVYLFAASPLFNGNTEMSDLVDDTGRKLISQEYSEAKWAKAAAAAKDVIDLGVYRLFTAPFSEIDISQSQPKTIIPPHHPVYSENSFPAGWKDIDPFESYRQLFNGALTPDNNPELIFSRIMNVEHTNRWETGVEMMVLHQVPYSLKGWNTHGITQKQCDAYYMNDGNDIPINPRITGFTTNSRDFKPLPANVSLQYYNREPRFYASVAYNGSIWENTSAMGQDMSKRYSQVFYYRGDPDGKQPSSPAFHIRTGIGIKKYYNPIDSYLENGQVIPKYEPAIRYAEVLLIYAEALNELTGTHNIPSYDGNQTIAVSRNISEMSKYFSQIRIRGGIPDLDNSVYSDAGAFRKALKRERQIELFAETHRYFDLRRWKDAPEEEGALIYGCNMNMTRAQREEFHVPIVITSLPTIFVRKMYFWPISHDELRKNKRLTQNPGWTYYY